MENKANEKDLLGQIDLMIACKTGNVAAVREILKRRDDDGERVDINAKDENGQTALSFAKQSNNAEIVAIIEQNLFLRAVENGDIETVRTYLTPEDSNYEVLYRRAETNILTDHNEHHEYNSEQMDMQSRGNKYFEKPPTKRFNLEFEAQFTSKESLTCSVWLEAVAIAQRKCHNKMLNLLLNDDRFIYGFNKDEPTILHQAVAEYLEAKHNSRMLKTIMEFLLKSRKFNANVTKIQEQAIFEILYAIKPKKCIQLDERLLTFLQNVINLYDRYQNGQTFFMLACENLSIDIVRSLLKLVSRGSVRDIDAVDNSGKTALMKAKEKNFCEIVLALLERKLISAVKDENVDIVKSMLPEFRNTVDNFVKSWSSKQNLDNKIVPLKTKSDIWLDAIYIAMVNDTKHSEEILNLLLDCDMFLSQDIETGYSSFYQFLHRGKVDADKKLRLIELLLKSGKINANDRDSCGRTMLHLSEEEKLTSLLIRYGADVNKKDNAGMTPLMPILDKSNAERFPVLQTLLEETGTLVNLDAVDFNGRTALMYAVKDDQSHDVEFLLNKGASVNLSNHLGFTALHYALYKTLHDHFEFPRNSEELKKIKDVALFFDTLKHKLGAWGNEAWSEERRKIVEMLLKRPDIDVNALSFERFSPLDIAEGQIPDIPSSIKNALKEKGAVLNVFRQTKLQLTSDFGLDFTCKLTLKHIDIVAKKLYRDNFKFLKERWTALTETFQEQKVSDKDHQGRTALHLTAISFYSLEQNEILRDLTDAIVKKLISLGCNVNETDIFGRTPLHYANFSLKDSLISHGADASIKDKDGNIAIVKTPRPVSYKSCSIVREVTDRYYETYLLRLMNNTQMEINVKRVDDSNDGSDGDGVPEFWRDEVNIKTTPRLLWENGEYALCHPSVNQITKDVRDLMNDIARKIEKLDPRFEIRPELVGSSNGGTRVGKPNEFDFCFVLTKISELCEVSFSPELPTGFVLLKRRPTKVGEKSDFDSFFGIDEILNTMKLNGQFAAIFSNALVNIDSQQSLEWILEMPLDHCRIFTDIRKVFTIKMIKPLNFFSVAKISIDIVPCIHIDGWWPDEAISNVSDEIKTSGCNFIFDRPQELYPWVPYSEFCARISFSKAESDMIKQSCHNLREAYMIGKAMLEKSNISVSKYILKNCSLYCIEALSPSSEKASKLGLSHEEMESKFHQMDRYLWLKCLMKCHLEFVAQDFCPCYFLPNFSNISLIDEDENYLKRVSFDWIADRICKFTFTLSCKEACALYRCTSNDASESSYQLPAPDPLWERFDRKKLIANLCEIAYK